MKKMVRVEEGGGELKRQAAKVFKHTVSAVAAAEMAAFKIPLVL